MKNYFFLSNTHTRENCALVQDFLFHVSFLEVDINTQLHILNIQHYKTEVDICLHCPQLYPELVYIKY